MKNTKLYFALPVVTLLASCTTLPECTYTGEGAEQSVCLSYISGRPLMPRQTPIHSLDEYEISYIKYPSFSAVAAVCKLLTGESRRGCADINYTRMTATIHSVYSDHHAVEHELAHLTHPYDWETTYTHDLDSNWN